MADIMKQIFSKPIQYADEIVKLADQANTFRQECLEIKGKTEKLAALLRQAAGASGVPYNYERPTRLIMDDTELFLKRTLTLVTNCCANRLRRIFTTIPAASFRKISFLLEISIGDVSWLLRFSTPAADRGGQYIGLPPMAATEPILCVIWEQIAVLCSGSGEERTAAAAALASLAGDNDRYASLIVEEGGVAPLLRLAEEGGAEGQENAARAIGLLGREPESVERIVNAGARQVFAKILKEGGDVKVQEVVTWAVAELAAHQYYSKCHLDPCADVAKAEDDAPLMAGQQPSAVLEMDSGRDFVTQFMQLLGTKCFKCVRRFCNSVCG